MEPKARVHKSEDEFWTEVKKSYKYGFYAFLSIIRHEGFLPYDFLFVPMFTISLFPLVVLAFLDYLFLIPLAAWMAAFILRARGSPLRAYLELLIRTAAYIRAALQSIKH